MQAKPPWRMFSHSRGSSGGTAANPEGSHSNLRDDLGDDRGGRMPPAHSAKSFDDALSDGGQGSIVRHLRLLPCSGLSDCDPAAGNQRIVYMSKQRNWT